MRVQVGSRDIARRIDAEAGGSRIRARACARSLEHGYRASCCAHEAVKQIARISIQSRDIPRRINAGRQRPLLAARACTRSLEGAI
jgi:hypothetical protein